MIAHLAGVVPAEPERPTPPTPPEDPWDRHRVASATGALADANRAGLLEPADVHVAQRVGRALGESDDRVLLAVALLVRAVREGSVCLDLASVPTLLPEADWPEVGPWREAVTASAVVLAGVVRESGTLLYLDRYWQEETSVCEDLLRRAQAAPPTLDPAMLAAALDAHFPGDGYTEQRAAAEIACRHWLSVITGGPGTGKTTTIARLLGSLAVASDRPLRIALAAPTGKAAARMGQALREASLREDFPDAYRTQVSDLQASTIHRLLGWQARSRTRFRHRRGNPLPHDIVVVDETSMVSLTLMARLLEALRPDTRLVLVGDADQLTSVEAGAVLTDLVEGLSAWSPSPVARLRRSHRFGSGIARLAEAVRTGNADAAVTALTAATPAGSPEVALVDVARAEEVVAHAATRLVDAAESGDPAAAIAALEHHRLLCAHRDGPDGVHTWNRRVARMVQERAGTDWLPEWYAGQPLLVTANDYAVGLFNGDGGVVVRQVGTDPRGAPATSALTGLVGLMDTGQQGGRPFALTRLAEVETAHAITVHRSQGSQFGAVTVVLPDDDSPLLTRELLYTAVTRAKERVLVVGSPEIVRAAVERRARRATGLAARLAQP